MFPNNIATTIAMFTWCLLAIVISYAFTSSLIAGLSVRLKTRPPQTFKELEEQDYVVKPFVYGSGRVPYAATYIGETIMVSQKTCVYRNCDIHFFFSCQYGDNDPNFIFASLKDNIVRDKNDTHAPKFTWNTYMEYNKILSELHDVAIVSSHFPDVLGNPYEFDAFGTGDRLIQKSKESSNFRYFDYLMRKTFIYLEEFSCL